MTILTPKMANNWTGVFHGAEDAPESIATGRTIVVDAELNREVWALMEKIATCSRPWWLVVEDARALIAKRNGT